MTKKTPKISIIIPIYNVEKYLNRCLYSVVNQTFEDWEAICMLDGSTDRSAKILKKYATQDNRIKDFHIGINYIYEIYTKPELKKALKYLHRRFLPPILRQQLHRCQNANQDIQNELYQAKVGLNGTDTISNII